MLKDALQTLRRAERPIMILGAGSRSAAADALELARLFGIPIAPTWGARDLVPEDSGALCVGGFGTHGTRAANFAVQNADWILSVGSRLDSKATGTPREYFARGADIFMADIDLAEVKKFAGRLGRSFTGVQADAKMFLTDAIRLVHQSGMECGWPNFAPWRGRCLDWLVRYPVCAPEYELEEDVNPYVFVRELSARCRPGDVIVSDTGLSLAWLMQGFAFKSGQIFVHALNQTPMGYGLPAAIGAAFAAPGRRIILVTGDGGFMLNMQELSVVAKHNLPIKIVLLNNGGHAMCRQTQEQWLGGKYYSTSPEHGLAFPNFRLVAGSCKIDFWYRDKNRDVPTSLDWLLRGGGAAFLELAVPGDRRLIPQVPYGTPNEDGGPRLSREQLHKEMIVGVVP